VQNCSSSEHDNSRHIFKSVNHRDCALKIIGKEFQKTCYKTIFRKINTEEILSQN